jgi:hypothetical protein
MPSAVSKNDKRNHLSADDLVELAKKCVPGCKIIDVFSPHVLVVNTRIGDRETSIHVLPRECEVWVYHSGDFGVGYGLAYSYETWGRSAFTVVQCYDENINH